MPPVHLAGHVPLLLISHHKSTHHQPHHHGVLPNLLQEFIDYFFLQRAATSTTEGGTDWRLHPQAGVGASACPYLPAALHKRLHSSHCGPARGAASTMYMQALFNCCMHMQDLWRKEWRGCAHKEAVDRVYCCPSPLEQYITGGRGGQLRYLPTCRLLLLACTVRG